MENYNQQFEEDSEIIAIRKEIDNLSDSLSDKLKKQTLLKKIELLKSIEKLDQDYSNIEIKNNAISEFHSYVKGFKNSEYLEGLAFSIKFSNNDILIDLIAKKTYTTNSNQETRPSLSTIELLKNNRVIETFSKLQADDGLSNYLYRNFGHGQPKKGMINLKELNASKNINFFLRENLVVRLYYSDGNIKTVPDQS